MAFLEKLQLWWTKTYLWVGLGAVLLLLALFFWKRKAAPVASDETKAELEGLEKVALSIKTSLAKADNDAQIKVIKAEAQDQIVHEQVDQIAKMDDEFERAKALVALRKTQLGSKS